MRIDRTMALAGGTAVVVLVAATLLVFRPWVSDPFAACRQSVVAGGGPTIGGPFTLVDESGKTVTDKEVLTKPALVYFGYTFCPDICPTDLARNAEAVDLLAERGFDVTPVFISVDPHRDTPERLAEWTPLLSPKIVGLTGTPAQIDAAAKAYRTYYNVPQDTSAPDYIVGHQTNTFLMSPEHGFLEFFSSQDSPEKIAETTACYLNSV